MLIILISLTTGLGIPSVARGDGTFVVPRFVWDKNKDINEPAQKAILVYDAGWEDLILQVKYEGPTEKFGWIIPVPNVPDVHLGAMECFYELSKYTQQRFDRGMPVAQSIPGGGGSLKPSEPAVTVIETKTVGDYNVTIISAKNSEGLEHWLETNQFYFPSNKTSVLDSYVKKGWYFVAVKINLNQKAKEILKTTNSLAAGELKPLQLSFKSDPCVFPLKISSVNGRPSEIQIYVLSPEPLLERNMWEKRLPQIYTNDLAQAAQSAESQRRMWQNNISLRRRFAGALQVDVALSPEEEKSFQKLSKIPIAGYDEFLPFAKVTKADLPDCAARIDRLKDKAWWLTKQTWTFQPDEMRDLEFTSAFLAFADELGTKFGYFAAASLNRFESDAVPTLLAAAQSPNPKVRSDATSVFNEAGGPSWSDARFTQAAVGWLKDSEANVRRAGVNVLTQYHQWNPTNAASLVAMLQDEDPGVRSSLVFALPRFQNDLEKFIPSFLALLSNSNPGIRKSGLELNYRLGIPIPIASLRTFFDSHDQLTLGLLAQMFFRQDVSDDDIIPLLQNPDARMICLHVLARNQEKQSVELTLPMLRDSDELVRIKAAQVLCSLTGQHFTEDEADKWVAWWNEHKKDFVVESHPEELRPKRFLNGSRKSVSP